MSLCQNIETLAMAYLDDELVAEERRELELHILDCTSCREHVDHERTEIASLRQALVAPPASDMLKARLQRALDEEDRQAARRSRKQWSRWFLPGSAAIAAAAAIAVFVVGLQTPEPPNGQRVAKEVKEVVRQQTRSRPLEVQGAGTGRWLRENFAPIDPPSFGNQSVQLLGARLTAINGHDAAQLQYLVTHGANQFTLTAVVIADLGPDDLNGGQPIKVGERVLHVYDVDGMPTISYVDEHRMGYTFASQRLSAQELLELVVSSDLIGRAARGR